MTTQNGRPSHLGAIYFEHNEEFGISTRKYCAGYCPKCKTKIGLTPDELKDFSFQLPSKSKNFLLRLLHLKIIMP